MEASLLSGQTNCKEDGKCKGVKGPPSPWSAPVDVSATPDGEPLLATTISQHNRQHHHPIEQQSAREVAGRHCW